MCQGLSCCECVYASNCHSCIGLSVGLFCCGCWLCVPEPLEHMRYPGCCKCEFNQGCGSSFFCVSTYCCIPEYLKNFSRWCSIAHFRGDLYDVTVKPQAVVQREMRGPESNRNLY